MMSIKSEQLFTNVHPSKTLGKIIQFPISRMLISVLFILPFLIFHNKIIGDFIASAKEPYHSLVSYIDTIISIIVILLFYRLYVKYIERRKSYEITLNDSYKEFCMGFIVSLGLVGLMVLLMFILGYYKINNLNSWKIIIDSIFFFGMGAFIQVLFFRIIVFRLAEELFGSWTALALIAFIFGLVHLMNVNATIGTSLAIMIADVLLIAAFIYTRRIWFVWGLHTGWNFFQDGIFGMPNSGVTQFPSWIDPIISGPQWITGGNFGIEASCIAIFMSLIAGIIILKIAVNENKIVMPVWKRK